MTETIPWRTDEELAVDDAARAEQSYAEQLDMDIAREVRRLKILDAARARVTAEKEAAADFSGLYLTRSQLLDLPAPEPLIDKVLPRHSYAILRGRDHSFKSFVAIDWACCLATGKPWQGHDTEPIRVLYIAGEGAHGIQRRVEAWEYAWSHNVPDDMLTVRRSALNMHTPGPAFTDLLGHVHDGRYGLVIVDTLRRVSGSADGNGSEMGAVVDNLDRIKHATADGSVLVVAHTDKADHDSRGYSGIEDDADVVWHAKRDDMFLALELTKMKDGPDGRTVHLEAKPTIGSLILASGSGTPSANTTESQLKILDTIRDLFPDGAAGTELRTTAGLTKSTFYRALRDLVEAGHLVNTGTKKTPYYELPALPLDGAETTAEPSGTHPPENTHA